MLKAVIFDVDGTLIDSVQAHAHAWVRALAHFGHEAALEDVLADIGKGGDQLMPGFVPPDAVEAQGEEIEAFRADLFKREFLPDIRPFPGVRELFERLRADGRKVVLASSATEEEVGRYAELIGAADLLDGSTSKDDAEQSKPFPDIFQAALARLKSVEPQEAVVIGDTPYDAEAARAAGVASIGVLTGGFTEESLRSAGCAAVYRDLADLLANYERSPLGVSA